MEADGKTEVFSGFDLTDGTHVAADMAVFGESPLAHLPLHSLTTSVLAIGIKSRDDLARSSGIDCHTRGGVIVGDDLSTSVPNVFAIGECTSWKGNTYGLIAPGGQPLI